MKTLLIAALGLLLMAGCTPNAQLITLRGNNVKPATDGLVLDNDTLTLRYSFYSDRGLMSMTLYNKLSVPLYVDWKKSAFIVGKNKLDYWNDVADVNLTGSSYRYYRLSTASLSGTISKDDQVGFIPPRTELRKQQFVVVPGGELPLPGQPVVKQAPPTYYGANPRKLVNVQEYTYSPAESPLTFRNFLTLSTQRDFQKEFYLDTSFWASDIQVMPKPQLEGDISADASGFLSGGQHPYKSPDAFYLIMKLPDNPSAR